MNRPLEGPSHVSLFPLPPWQLIDKYTDAAVAENTAPPPPSIPISSSYMMFGILYNTDDPIIRSLKSSNVKRVYPEVRFFVSFIDIHLRRS